MTRITNTFILLVFFLPDRKTPKNGPEMAIEMAI
tara:strand:- start:497 stop:598 length:102 start_codon:yes stop_codon:yes gene_type:complete